jgi:hypothetical protein
VSKQEGTQENAHHHQEPLWSCRVMIAVMTATRRNSHTPAAAPRASAGSTMDQIVKRGKITIGVEYDVRFRAAGPG